MQIWNASMQLMRGNNKAALAIASTLTVTDRLQMRVTEELGDRAIPAFAFMLYPVVMGRNVHQHENYVILDASYRYYEGESLRCLTKLVGDRSVG
jgi:hypothetical protein